MPQSLSDRAETLARAGEVQPAVELLRSEAAAGNPEAFHILANWALEGDLVRRDLRLSRDLFRRAAEAGHAAAASVYRAFLANGTGGPRDWPQALSLMRGVAAHDQDVGRQLALIKEMRLADDGDPLEVATSERLSASPDVRLFRSLCTLAECDFLTGCAEASFAPSLVVDPVTGGQMPHPIRTSDGTSFPLATEKPAIHALNRRLAAASGTRADQGEPLQVLRYRAGQEYRPHSDALTGTDNQRILTFLVYLTEDYEGGETAFLRADLEVKGRKGDGLLFRNADMRGRPDPLSLHAGLPVTQGIKVIASRWIRTRPLDLSGPPG